MTIKFTCPKGHKLSCPDDRAGRRGKCPECATLFQVPKPEPSADGGSKVYRAEEIIEFFCPNDHKLTSPARLAGKRGQCPHCGSMFLVPGSAVEAGPAGSGAGATAGGAGAASAAPGGLSGSGDFPQLSAAAQDEIEEIEEIEEVPEELSFLPPAPPAESGSVWGAPPEAPPTGSGAPGAHALALLFERIWVEADREAIIEVELASGDKFTPLDFSHDLSRGQHGVFATKDRDGSHTLIITPWDNVKRVTVRGLKELPETMFN